MKDFDRIREKPAIRRHTGDEPTAFPIMQAVRETTRRFCACAPNIETWMLLSAAAENKSLDGVRPWTIASPPSAERQRWPS